MVTEIVRQISGTKRPHETIKVVRFPCEFYSKSSVLSDGPTAAPNVAHFRQSWPDSGLNFQLEGIEIFEVVPSSLGRGLGPRGQIRMRSTPWAYL